MYLIYNKEEWLIGLGSIFKWTEQEIDNADEKGLIGRKFGVDCYLSRNLLAQPPKISE